MMWPIVRGIAGLLFWLIGPIRVILTLVGGVLKLGAAVGVRTRTTLRWIAAVVSTAFTLLGVTLAGSAVAIVMPDPLAETMGAAVILALLPVGIGTLWAVGRYLKRREALIESEDAWAEDILRVTVTPFVALSALFGLFLIETAVNEAKLEIVARHALAWGWIKMAALSTLPLILARAFWRRRHFTRVDEAIASVKRNEVDAARAGALFDAAVKERGRVEEERAEKKRPLELAAAERHDEVMRATWIGVSFGVLGFLGLQVLYYTLTPVPAVALLGYFFLIGVPMLTTFLARRRIWREVREQDRREWEEAAAQGLMPAEYKR